MRLVLRFALSLVILAGFHFTHAQEICGDPPPVQCVCQVTPICGFLVLDGYCLDMDNFATPFSDFPGCPTNVLNNPNWFAFVAGTDELSIQIIPSDCQGIGAGGGTGLQAAIYTGNPNIGAACSNCNSSGQNLTALATQCGCVTNIITWIDLQTVPGETYYVVLDGCGGDICHIDINVLEGGEPPSAGTPDGPVSWPTEYFGGDTVCLGATNVLIDAPDAAGAAKYLWLLPDGTTIITDDSELFWDFFEEGVFEFCVFGLNDCDTSDMSLCTEITVAEIPTEFETETICEGDVTSFYDLTGLTDPGTYVTQVFTPLLGCVYDAELELTVINENDENPTQVEQVICIDDIPFFYHGTPYTQTTENDDVMILTSEGCDSFISFSIYVLTAQIIMPLPEELICINGKIEVCPTDIIFSPDPNQYSGELEISYSWVRLSDNIEIGTSECVEIDINDDFAFDEEGFELTVFMAFNGNPPMSCEFVSTELEINRQDYLPNEITVSGPDTVCQGDVATFFADPNDPTYFYEQILSQGVVCLSGCLFADPELQFNTIGSAEVCLIPNNGCGPGPEFCKVVEVLARPTADAGTDDVTCSDNYDLQGSAGNGSWQVVVAPPGGTATFSDPGNPNANVMVDLRGTYTFAWDQGFGDCLSGDSVEIVFSAAPQIALSENACDGTGENYVLELEVTGGVEPYSLNGLGGSFTGNIFTSDPIPVATMVDVTVSDGNNCDSAPFTYTRPPCDCNSEAGNMNQDLLEACQGGCIQTVHQGDQSLDGNDIFEYVLHSEPGSSFDETDILIRNTTGEFCYTPGTTFPDSIYYVSYAVGNDNGSGLVDFTDPCLSISQGQPIEFVSLPVSNSGTDDAICGLSYQMNAVPSSGNGLWSIISGPGAAIFDMASVPTTGVTVDECGVYVFKWKETNRACSDSSTVEITFNCIPELADGSLQRICNNTQTAYDVIFEIESGTGPFTEVNNRGTITDNIFMIEDLPPAVEDTFYIIDANGCGPLVVAVLQDCNCETDAGTMVRTPVLACEGQAITVTANPDEILDGDDVISYILHTSDTNTLGSIIGIFDSPNIPYDAAIECDLQYYISRVVGNDDGSGSVQLADGCTMVASGTPVVWYCQPVANAGADELICGMRFQLSASPSTGAGSWSAGPTGSPIFDDGASPTTTATVSSFGTHCFTWTEDNNGCISTDEVCFSFVGTPVFELATVDYTCNTDNDAYQVTVSINGGAQGSLVVEGLNGSISGGVFTSEFISSNTPFTIVVRDGNDCDRDTLSDVYDCGCLTDIGFMDNSPLELCEGDVADVSSRYDPSGATLDGNDVITYFLHDGNATTVVNPVQTSNSPQFSFNAGNMSYEVIYYISAVAGSNDGSGVPDLSDGCLSVAPGVAVRWHENPDFTISASNSEVTCQEPQVMLQVETSLQTADFDFIWSSPDGGSIEAGDEGLPNPRVNSKGTYVVIMRHKVYGCESQDQIFIDQADDVPVGIIATPAKLTCEVLEVTVDGSASSSGSDFVYEWSGPGIVGDNTGITVRVNLPGVYSMLIRNTANGCALTTMQTVEEDRVLPTASAMAADVLDCVTQQVTISGQGSSAGAGFTYSWVAVSSGANIVGNSSGMDVVVDAPGQYSLTVRNGNNGCESSMEVTVDELSEVISDAILDIKHPACSGESNGQITVETVVGGTSPYEYSFDGGLNFIPQNQSGLLGPGTFTVVVRDGGGCTFQVDATLLEPAEITVDLGDNLFVELGEPVILTAMPSISPTEVSAVIWSPLADSSNANTLTQEFLPPPGQSEYSVTIIDENGCSASDFVLIVARVQRNVYVPNAISPGPTSQEPNRFVGVYADPAKVPVVKSFRIFDRWGNQVFERTDYAPSLDLDRYYSWDGSFEGELMAPGVFVYYAEVIYSDNVSAIVTGDIVLIR